VGRRVAAADVPRVSGAIAAGGVHAIELTMDEPHDAALDSIASLVLVAADLGVLPGAGTVRSVGAARRAVEAGARFIVSPHTDTDIVAWCATRGVPCVPGAFSPTEILSAWAAGASAVKLFPAAMAGPGYLAQLAGPFPDIDIIPTGIQDPATVGDWFAAGAKAIGIRSGWLAGDGDPSGITERARRMVAATSS
jgi:2-dehydro-3-deoxyphosphogluconate aldolase/(4S)-4-hydroxy-2-oxoglutarate aldolase